MFLLPQYSHTGFPRLTSVLLFTLLGLFVFLLIFQTFTAQPDGADAPECRMSYMVPNYARVHAFDASHTRYASKYHLYLYRELGKDTDPDGSPLTGIPVLFVPGNAGSYKQVRALAAECSTLFHAEYKSPGPAVNQNSQTLDFFTADFNEDFTAFHGRTMLDQAEYLNDAVRFILLLYSDAKLVIVVGHSMGGVVARTMILLPNYVPNSINTFVTLAAPHLAAPVTFDGDLMRVYASMDSFWREGFLKSDLSTAKLARSRLENVALISITGGSSDTVLPADYTAVRALVPEEHGFAVFSTGIPGVWTPIDHLAIVWCDQLRKVLARALLEVVDSRSPDKTYKLPQRMAIFRKHLLSGFEDCAAADFAKSQTQLAIRLRVDNDQISLAIPGERSLIVPPNYSQNVFKRGMRAPKMNFFYFPENKVESFEFTALSSLPFARIEEFGRSAKPVALLCKAAGHSHSGMRVVDYTDAATSQVVELDCVDAASAAHSVPRSAIGTISASESSIGGRFAPYNVLQFNASTLSKFDLVVLGESPSFYSLENSQDFIVADLARSSQASISVGAPFWRFLFGVDINLPEKRPLAVDVGIPALWSSLVAYNLQVVRTFDKEAESKPANERFGPLIRQWIPAIFETKWLVGLNNEPEKLILFHLVAPFVPFPSDRSQSSLHLQVWSDLVSTHNRVKLKIRIALFSSLRLLVMRFRLVAATMPVALVAAVLARQFWIYNKSGKFVSFDEALMIFCEPKVSGTVCVLLGVLLIICLSPLKLLFYFLDPIRLSSSGDHSMVRADTELNPFFLGLEEGLLLLLGPLFYVILVSLVSLTYYTVKFVGQLFAVAFVAVNSRVFKTANKRRKLIIGGDGPFLRLKRRLLGTVLVLGSIPVFIPYQFVYVVLTLVLATICIKTEIRKRLLVALQPSSIALDKLGFLKGEAENFLNFNQLFLILLIWILPVNIPVLIVLVHNFALRWQTPFSLHHNFLAILPIFVVIERSVSGRIPPRLTATIPPLITLGILLYFVFYALVFGVRHAWWLHYLLNFFCAWLVFLNFDIWSVNVPTPSQGSPHSSKRGSLVTSGHDTGDVERRKSVEYSKSVKRSVDLVTSSGGARNSAWS